MVYVTLDDKSRKALLRRIHQISRHKFANSKCLKLSGQELLQRVSTLRNKTLRTKRESLELSILLGKYAYSVAKPHLSKQESSMFEYLRRLGDERAQNQLCAYFGMMGDQLLHTS